MNEIVITDKAVKGIKKYMKEYDVPETGGLRIGCRGGGCSGLSYVLVAENEPNADDLIFAHQDVRVFVDKKSFIFLKGMTLDYSTNLMESGFKIGNPQEKNRCGCGESFVV